MTLYLRTFTNVSFITHEIMEHSLKKELLAYFDGKDRNDHEEWLYNRLKTEINYFDITSVEKQDLEERGYDTSTLDDYDMERIANDMCGYYLDSCTFSEDLCTVADNIRLKMK